MWLNCWQGIITPSDLTASFSIMPLHPVKYPPPGKDFLCPLRASSISAQLFASANGPAVALIRPGYFVLSLRRLSIANDRSLTFNCTISLFLRHNPIYDAAFVE